MELHTFDRDDVAFQLEAMKLSQTTLQHLMTLSAGGLALYFGFIAKVTFLDPSHRWGILIVFCWIISLCSAALAHRLYAQLFSSTLRMLSLRRRAADQKAREENLPEQLSTALNPERLVTENQALVTGLIDRTNRMIQDLEDFVIPKRKTSQRLISVSLSFFVLGFILLAASYANWILSGT